MDKIIVYTIGCPSCNWLEQNLKKLKIDYEAITNQDEMTKIGMKSTPAMRINDGPLMYLPQIRNWVKEKNSNG